MAVADSTGSSKAPQMAKYLALLADGGHLGRATDKAGPREMNGRGKRQAAGPARDFCFHGQVLEVYFFRVQAMLNVFIEHFQRLWSNFMKGILKLPAARLC
jgi:hypothetical protein